MKLSSLWSSHVLPLAILVAAAVPASAQETGTLKMRFVYGGDPPAAENVTPNKDVEVCGQHELVDESLLVDPATKGIKNVAIYVYTGRGGSDLAEVKPKKETHILANKNCRFEPRFIVAQTGDTLKITNPDPVGHNANLNFFRNTAQNLMIPVGQEKDVLLTDAEPTAIPVDCNIHPWMRAYVLVLEHPFAAVSAEDGTVTIEGLPTGKELTFRVYHETGRISEVTVGGQSENWRRSRFETNIKPGVNDLGDVVVPASAF